MSLLHGDRPLQQEGSPRRQGHAGPEDAAGLDAVLQAGEWFTVREALLEAGRSDLMGNGCDCLIPAQPPKEAIEARRHRANDPDHYHTVANPAKGEKPGE